MSTLTSLTPSRTASSEVGVKWLKKKGVTVVLDADLIKKRINLYTTFQIDPPPPKELYISREFMASTYGGSMYQFVQFCDAHRNPSGRKKRCIVWAQNALNPCMPPAPGKPGLMFASRHDVLNRDNGPWTVFGHRPTREGIRWEYVGGYDSELCGRIGAADFKAQDPRVKEQWAALILKSKKQDCYVKMRKRITLRKHGRKVTDEAVDQLKDGVLSVDRKDIIRAFELGQEGIDIIRMQCVEYDHAFVADIQRKYSTWTPKEKNSKKAAKKPPQPKGKGKEKARHRNVSRSLSPSAESDGSAASDSVAPSRPRRQQKKSVSRSKDSEADFDDDARDLDLRVADDDDDDPDYESEDF
ncbi:hypothetical protein C8J56DRAFT_933452 [Mycena floridula]|nr:hypothetical protein C8J56DRAFT_933452 [Mycena floridula]